MVRLILSSQGPDFQVRDDDIWNMDEKGFMQGQQGKLRVLISKHEHNKLMTQCGNREWTTLIECINVTGKKLRPWIVFKGKQNKLAWADSYPEAHITTSENGWTDNEIGLLWIKGCFDPETTPSGDDSETRWRILALDGHASHISTQTVAYCITKKIILLCLPPHTTHFLQPLDIGIFNPLAKVYRLHIALITQFGAGYHIDKCDFLEQLKEARNKAISPINIGKAWRKSGLSPYNPERILQLYPPAEPAEQPQNENFLVSIRPATPPESTITYQGPDGGIQELLATPKTTVEIQRLLKRLKGEASTEVKQVIGQKVGNAAIEFMSEFVLENKTNTKLFGQLARKDAKKHRRKGNCEARVMNQELLTERQEIYNRINEWKRLASIHKEVLCRQQRLKQKQQRRSDTGHRVLNTPSKRALSVRAKARGIRLQRALAPTPPPATPVRPRRADCATPSRPPPTDRVATQKRRLMVKLRLRMMVTTQELNQGKWRLQQPQQEQKQEQEQAREHSNDAIGQLGRGHRMRRPRIL